MKHDATLLERFEGWFVAPIDKLKELPEGDGAFIAMSVGLFLCERFYRTKTNTHEGQGGDLAFRAEAAADLGVSPDTFEVFWKVFRHGIQHQGMPKEISLQNPERHFRWDITSHADGTPKIIPCDATHFMVEVNPWKFCDSMIQKFRDEPEILDKAESHAFGYSRSH